MRPTNTTAGRSGSMPNRRTTPSADASAFGEVGRRQPSRSIPLWTTCTSSGFSDGYTRRMSSRMPPLTAITAAAASYAVRSAQLDTA
jgi:hypothetical protein